MMTSKTDATEDFVSIWLPGATEPVVAGRLDRDGERLLFTYGASYRRRNLLSPSMSRNCRFGRSSFNQSMA
jgi:serine/threonine-protein kinase HipA